MKIYSHKYRIHCRLIYSSGILHTRLEQRAYTHFWKRIATNISICFIDMVLFAHDTYFHCEINCHVRSNCMPTVCQLYANCMPTVCQLYANCMPTVCQLCANYMPTVCQLYLQQTREQNKDKSLMQLLTSPVSTGS